MRNIFDNVNLLNEGEQAEAYKAKKAAEEEVRRKEEEERLERRRDAGNQAISNKFNAQKADIVRRRLDNSEFKDGHSKSEARKIDRDEKKLRREIDDASIKAGEAERVKTSPFSSKTKMTQKWFDTTNADISRERHAHDIAYKDHVKQIEKLNADMHAAEKDGSYDFKDFNKRNSELRSRYYNDLDAINRHMRRHPEKYKNESTIFESVSFLND